MTEQVQLSFSCDTDSEVPWVVSGLQFSEHFNQPYQMRLEMRTDDPLAEPTNMLGQPITLTIERDGFTRELDGIVECVEDGLADNNHLLAALTVVPALAALGYRRNSRIFQDISIKDILVEVLEAALGPYNREIDVGFLNAGDYPLQEYTVQYRETDLDFVHRLMEEYGITYRFEHEGGAETMVLLDNDSGYVDLVSLGNEDGMVPMVLQGGGAGEIEDLREFYRESKLRSTVARTTVFDWLDPASTQDEEDEESSPFDIPNGAEIGPEREDYNHDSPTSMFGYRSAGLDFSEVTNQVGLRRKVHQRDAVTFSGFGTATHMAPGTKFELLDHPQADLNAHYLVVAVDHAAGDFADPNNPEESYTNRFQCVPLDVEWRPERKTPRPQIPSMQTATVVGPAGEEIHTDEHGRIMVQFHWDRRKNYNEEASCFVRVVQPWSGNGWGFVFLPRIGMEVSVTFLEGDPDRPVVTGCLYNGDHATPHALPGNKTKSTIKTQSSPGGDGFNELSFEDAAGSEEIYIHAQKNLNEVVLANHDTTVGNNQTNNVDVDQTQTVHGNQVEIVDGNQEMTVKTDRTVVVVGAFDERVEGGETRNIACGVTENIIGGETRTVADGHEETITGGEIRTVTGGITETINGDTTYNHHGNVTDTTDGVYTLTATGGLNITAPAGMKVTVPGGITTVDPSSTTEAFSVFQKVVGVSSEAVGLKYGVVGLKVEAVGTAIAVIAVKIDMVGFKVDLSKIKYSNNPLSIKQAATNLRNAAFGVYMYGCTLFM